MKFICPKHGEIEEVLVDGYGFGDRLLEGCMFRVTLTGDAENPEYHAALPEDGLLDLVDKEQALKDCVRYVSKHDFGTCSHKGCFEDVCLEPWSEDLEELEEYRRQKGWA